jgi:hypothetical protein
MSAPTVSVPPRHPVPPPPPWGAWRVVMLVLGSLACLLGLGLLAGGVVTAAAGVSGDGQLESGPGRLSSDLHAVTVPGVDIDLAGPEVSAARELLGQVRIEAAAPSPDDAVFIGIGPTEDVDRYLAGVAYSEVIDLDVDPFRATYRDTAGTAPATPPGEQDFWAVSDAGTGTRGVDWDVAPGDWTVVVMNADGSIGVEADVTLGGTLRLLGWVAGGLFTAGAVVLVVGIALVVTPIVTRPRRPAQR